MHTYTFSTTNVVSDLGELVEILGDTRVQMMQLHYDLGCRIFQTASHIYLMYAQFFEHSFLWWMGLLMCTHTFTTTNVAPDLGEMAEIMGDVS